MKINVIFQEKGIVHQMDYTEALLTWSMRPLVEQCL
jgi:hypothetical protein